MPGHSTVLSVLGTFILWLGWCLPAALPPPFLDSEAHSQRTSMRSPLQRAHTAYLRGVSNTSHLAFFSDETSDLTIPDQASHHSKRLAVPTRLGL
eukprot:4445778-Pleurochrysis_carterae.AAC.1